MAVHKLAVIIKSSSNNDEILLVRQTRPPKFDDEEYDSYLDSDLWDLPSAPLSSFEGEFKSSIVVEGLESCLNQHNLSEFDLNLALNQIFGQCGLGIPNGGQWIFWKYVEEAEFGPGSPVHTVFVVGTMAPENERLPEICKWMSVQSCSNWLLEVKPSNDRLGPLVVTGLLADTLQLAKCKVPPTLHYQEYPPGIVLVPMESRTAKPFHTTNLVVFAPKNTPNVSEDDSSFVAYGDALIVDPGCHAKHHAKLMEAIAGLPRKLVVFVTHHHHDHVDGLSIIQKCNPDATLLAHENTVRRIGKDDWSLGYISVSGDEEICIGSQRLRVICAPGHTDGHMALLHFSTHSLIVGDHCVGQGSAVLDITSGGNMTEYFKTTYKFLEISPFALIPMHGRVNLWPKHMLCGYLKNRRHREASILKSIEMGAKTLFEIVESTYSDVDPSFWIPAASNVRLHVEHLLHQDRLPKEFSLQKFQSSCGPHFLLRWLFAYLEHGLNLKTLKLKAKLLIAVAVGGFAMLYAVNKKLINLNKTQDRMED